MKCFAISFHKPGLRGHAVGNNSQEEDRWSYQVLWAGSCSPHQAPWCYIVTTDQKVTLHIKLIRISPDVHHELYHMFILVCSPTCHIEPWHTLTTSFPKVLQVWWWGGIPCWNPWNGQPQAATPKRRRKCWADSGQITYIPLPRVTELVVLDPIGQNKTIWTSVQESGPASHQAVTVDRVNAGIESAKAAQSAAVASTSQVGPMLAIVGMAWHVMTICSHTLVVALNGQIKYNQIIISLGINGL